MKKNKPIAMMDLLIETHIGLERQGPGSPEATIRALSFLEPINELSRVADLGCGTGGQTMVLAQNITGRITGVDLFPAFIEVLNDKVKKRNLQNRVNGIVGSIDNLSFQKEEFDLIWSEGAIDNIGFEKGLSYWNQFLKVGGYIAVTSPSWLTEERPSEIEKFWTDAGSGLEPIEQNVSVMQKCGYRFVAAFAIPEKCWTENYFIPREAGVDTLLEKYSGDQTVEAFVGAQRHETQLYTNYKQHYGYVFYIGKKI